MDMNEYCVHAMVRERITAMQDEVRIAHLSAATPRPRRPLRMVVGRLLVRAGNRLLEGFTPARATA